MTRARTAIALLASAGLLLLASLRPWVAAVVNDVVLGRATLDAGASDVAPGVSAIGFALVAAGLAVAIAGARVRYVVLAVAVALAALAAWLTLAVLLDPGAAVGPVAAARVGRTGTVNAQADATAWVTLAFVAAVAAGSVAFAGLLAARGWPSAGRRYAQDADDAAPAPGHRVSDRQLAARAWDDLTAGVDPTEGRAGAHKRGST